MGKRTRTKPSEQESKAPRSKTDWIARPWLQLTALFALCFVVYGNALSGEFVWDDQTQIVRNETIHSLDNIPKAFTMPLWAFVESSSTRVNRYYRPLQNVIFTLTYQIDGLSPRIFHLVNVVLHALACVLVFLICREMGLSNLACLVAAAVFAVHPIHSEAVAWISGLGEVMCGLFYFAAVWMFMRYLNSRNVVWTATSGVCFFLALLSKEMAATFPIVAALILAMQWKERKLSLKSAIAGIAPSLFVLVLYGVLRFSVLGFNVPSTFEDHPGVFDWLTFGIWIFARYVRYALVPYPLAVFHPSPLFFSDRIVSTVLSALLIAVVGLLFWYWRKTDRTGLWWFAMFAVMLGPVFYFKGITGGSIFAERYLYIPTLAFVLLFVLFWQRLGRTAAMVSAIAVIATFSTMTMIRNLDWDHDEVLYRSSLDVYPQNIYAWLSLGRTYLNAENYAEAQICLEKAESYVDDRSFVHSHGEQYQLELELGTLAAKQSRSAEAKRHLNKAVSMYPEIGSAYTILGGVLMNLDRDFSGAVPILEKAIELSPADDQARDSMGVALYNLRRFDESVEYFREATRINPGSELAQRHLETALKHVR